MLLMHYVYVADLGLASTSCSARSGAVSQPPHPAVVVSLTTIPSRLRSAALLRVLDSIQLQKPPPDRVVLHVPFEYSRFPGGPVTVPDTLTALPWLTVHRPHTDHGPATKLLGLLRDEGGGLVIDGVDDQTVLVICDDDSIKLPGWLEGLVDAVRAAPDAAASYFVHPLDVLKRPENARPDLLAMEGEATTPAGDTYLGGAGPGVAPEPQPQDGPAASGSAQSLGAVAGWLGFGVRLGLLRSLGEEGRTRSGASDMGDDGNGNGGGDMGGGAGLTDLLHFKWLQAGACDLVDDHLFTAYFHFRGVKILNLRGQIDGNAGAAGGERGGTVVVPVPALSGTDALTHAGDPRQAPEIANQTSRADASMACRVRVYGTTLTTFPFWCCWGCCAPAALRLQRRLATTFDEVRRGVLASARTFCMARFANPNHIALCLHRVDQSGTVSQAIAGAIRGAADAVVEHGADARLL